MHRQDIYTLYRQLFEVVLLALAALTDDFCEGKWIDYEPARMLDR